MFLLTVRTYWDSFESSGYPISLNFATLLSKDAKGLLLSDGVLVFSTGVVVPVRTSLSLPNPANLFLIRLPLLCTVHEISEKWMDSVLLDWGSYSTRVPGSLARRRDRVDF